MLDLVVTIQQCCHDLSGLEERARQLQTLAHTHEFVLWEATATMTLGWVLIQQGHSKRGITQLEQGLRAFEATGAAVARPYYLALLAEGYGKNGQPQEGLKVLAEAVKIMQETGAQFYAAEVYRQQGKLLLALGARKSKGKGQKCQI